MEELSLNLFNGYKKKIVGVDELLGENGHARESQKWLYDYLNQIGLKTLAQYHKLASRDLQKAGAYFNLSKKGQKENRALPFDVIPRVIPYPMWQKIESGLKQRVVALNLFLEDLYGDQKILKKNSELKMAVETSPGYLKQLKGHLPIKDNYLHISGIDIVLDDKNELKVLEDNLRTPSGISFAMKNRLVSRKLFPDLFSSKKIHSIRGYPIQLRNLLENLSEGLMGKTVVLTPGRYNCAYFEHAYLAKEMGSRLVEGHDLFVENKKVYIKTENGVERVKAIYRRVNDDYLDPNFFNQKSLLGVPNLMEAYLAKNVVLANSVGNGVADDKAVYPFVSQIIQYYLSEEPILGQIDTYSCLYEKQKKYVLKNLKDLVVKTTNGSGGHNIFMGMKASKAEHEAIKIAIEKMPRNFIAQPLVELSSYPTYFENKLLPKRVDFRAFVLGGKSPWVLPGGLTRVALKQNAYIVNSSQGGGAKDTWVMEE